jgi:hypothetical protein
MATELMTTAKIQGEGAAFMGLMSQKGIVDIIEKITDHKDRDVYVKAEEFTETIS